MRRLSWGGGSHKSVIREKRRDGFSNSLSWSLAAPSNRQRKQSKLMGQTSAWASPLSALAGTGRVQQGSMGPFGLRCKAVLMRCKDFGALER